MIKNGIIKIALLALLLFCVSCRQQQPSSSSVFPEREVSGTTKKGYVVIIDNTKFLIPLSAKTSNVTNYYRIVTDSPLSNYTGTTKLKTGFIIEVAYSITEDSFPQGLVVGDIEIIEERKEEDLPDSIKEWISDRR